MPVIDLGSVVGPQGPQGATGATGAQGIQGNPGPNQVTDQTSTNLNGVLFGNQSRVTVKPVDATPTADSTNLVSSGSVKSALDVKANQVDLTSIRAIGTTNTTGAAIPAGAYFYLNGILCQAKVQIGQNATFTVNTNCEQVTEGGLNDVNSIVMNDISFNSGYSATSGETAQYGKTKNGIVIVSGLIRHGSTDITPFEPFTLPEGYRPKYSVTFLGKNSNHGYVVMGSIGPDGVAVFLSMANTFASGASFNTGLPFRDVYFEVCYKAAN